MAKRFGKKTISRRATGRLNSFVAAQQPVTSDLPAVHVTHAYHFVDMLDSNKLTPTKCNVFGENLLYLFYGRPAYRAADGNDARLEFEWPIVCLFAPNRLPPIKRVFPFDTGAFDSEMYKEFFSSASELEDFSISPPSLESARKIVGAFYQSNNEYYSGDSRKNVEIPLQQFEAQGIQELTRLPGAQDVRSPYRRRDERSSAIEIQLDKPLPFTGRLIGVVMPRKYLDLGEIRDALKRWQVTNVRDYIALHNAGSEAWVGQVYAIVRQLYIDLGYLDV